MAYPTAIGCGCLLGAGGASHAFAAQWSLQPTFGWELDYDSSRSLDPGVAGSEEAVLTADLLLQRSLENSHIMLEPHFDVRRFSDSVWGPGDDRSLAGAFSWSGDRTQLSFTGSIANQNTLTTELQETGIVATDSRRRSETAGGELDFSRTEQHLFFAQVNYLGSSYSGPANIQELLPGYRYESASAGERFMFSEHLTLCVSAFGDILHSDRAGGSSHEAGGQLELSYAHSQRATFNVQVGESRRVLTGSASNGTNISASATRNFERGSVSFSYVRNLTPYGNGYLVQRQLISATATRALTPYLDIDLRLIRIQNDDSTVRLHLDRRFYDNAGLGLNWKLSETWTLRPELTASWSPPLGSNTTAREWRAALTMTWKPLPQVVSR